MIEPIGESAQVHRGVFAKFKRVMRARQTGLQVAQDGIDPLELWQLPGFELPDHERRMRAAGLSDPGKARQAIGADEGAWRQMGLSSLCDSLARKCRQWAQLEMGRAALFVECDCRNEGDLVRRSAPRLGAIHFTAQVGVIELDMAAEPLSGGTVGHRPHDLVMHQPSGGVAHADLALQGQRRESGLGLTDQVNGQEPGGQGPLGAGKQSAGRERALVAASVALVQPPAVALNKAMRGGCTGWADESVGPAYARQRVLAARLVAEVAQEVRQRHAGLELDGVAGHGCQSAKRGHQGIEGRAHRVSSADECC